MHERVLTIPPNLSTDCSFLFFQNPPHIYLIERVVCAVIKKRFPILKLYLVIPLLQILIIELQVYLRSVKVTVTQQLLYAS